MNKVLAKIKEFLSTSGQSEIFDDDGACWGTQDAMGYIYLTPCYHEKDEKQDEKVEH